MLQDLRYALRQLRKSPAFTVVAVLVIALGVGTTTAIFSAVNPILFEPLPYPHPGRIMMIWEARSDGSPMDVTFGSFHGLVDRDRSFQALAVMKPWQPTMTSATQPERFEGQRVSSAYFHALGVLPALGRDFQTSDDQYKGPNVVILSDRVCGGASAATRRSWDAKSRSTTTSTRSLASCQAASKTCWLRLLNFGRRCNTTRRCHGMAENGAITCG